MKNLLEEKSCEICGSNDFSVLFSWPREYYPHVKYETCSWDGRQKIPLNIVTCSCCGLVYTRPSFKEEKLNLVYPEDIIPEDIKSNFVEDKKNISLLKSITKYRKKGTLLDIGCRYGAFPWLASKKGFNAYGIEFNSASVEKGRHYFSNIFEGTPFNLENVLKKNNLRRPDIVVMDDVVEHLVHPKKDLRKIFDAQKIGGIIVLRQMDYNSLGRRLFGKRWYYFQPAAHQYYFDKEHLVKLLSDVGYETLEVKRRNVLVNLLFTVLKFIHNSMKRKPKSGTKNRISYLTKRLKSYDDMFTIVAEKI
ncbi:MAG: class I SAM-dependent methyltransferase [Candidatus Woesearchaeota archaeon]